MRSIRSKRIKIAMNVWVCGEGEEVGGTLQIGSSCLYKRFSCFGKWLPKSP